MFENTEVPFITQGNRQILTEKQTIEMPWLKEFIECFPGCFEYYPSLQA
jgi:hypothetical protein